MVDGFPTVAEFIQPVKSELKSIWWQNLSSGSQTMSGPGNISLKLWNVSTQPAALGQEAPISP